MAKHTNRTLRQRVGDRAGHALRGQRGSTLVGELIALTIMGVTLVIFMSGLSTTSAGVGLIEQRVSAENYARQQMELVKAAAYQPNPTAAPYPTVAVRCPESAPACTPVYRVQTDVTYWHEDTQTFTSTQPSPEAGLQKVRVQVYSAQRPGLPVFTLEGLKAEVVQP
jgi:type II secretory pathway pseudopilin PulG